jgi:hypothetical protein
MNNPTQRDRDTIIDMLQAFRAAQETLLCGVTGSSGNPKLMPKTWTPEMRELERCLGQLCRVKPKHHRHVMARYVDPTISRRTMVGRATRRGGIETIVWPQLGPHSAVVTSAKLPEHKGTSTYSCLVASWPTWVNKIVVGEAVDSLVRWYTPPSEAVGPAMPLEMIAA